MKIRSLVLHDLKLPLRHPFETSFGRVDHNRTLLIETRSDEGVGWGECPAGEGPFFSYETTRTAIHVIRDHYPRDWSRVRGHPMAKAAIEMALAWARGKPLKQTYGGSRDRIESGISIGIDVRLMPLVEAAVARGYRRVKLKIKPGRDAQVVREVRRRFPNLPLMVDANGAYRLEDAAALSALDEFNLMMIEQPLAYDDLFDHAALAKRVRTPLCLDESIRHAADARHAIALGACRIINIKPGRVGGPAEVRRVHDVAAEAGVPVWCGGMLESGVGRVHNVALASLPNFSLPGDVSPSDRYYEEDVIDPPVEMAPDGTIDATRPLPRVREDVVARYRVGREEIVFDV